MFLLNLVRVLVTGFPLPTSFAVVAFKEAYVFVCFLVPVFALAAITASMTDLIILCGALVAVYASALSIAAVLMGADRCPTCETGLSWMQHVLQHVGTFLGASVIVAVQYYRRRTRLSRVLALGGVLALVFVQLPWDAAFNLQSWLSSPSGLTAPVGISFDPEARRAGGASRRASGGPSGAGQATRAFIHGDTGGALKYLERRTLPRDAPVEIRLPVQIAGMSADELLLVDRSDVRLSGDDGQELYRGADSAALVQEGNPADDTARGPRSGYQGVYVPATVYQRAAPRDVGLQIDYFLTLMKVVAQHPIAARDGELQAADIGRCATKIGQDSIALRCMQIGPTPFCFSATLYGPDGRHNPEIPNCDPDYRPYIPAPTDPVRSSGVDVPVRDPFGLAHYPVDPGELDRSYIIIRIYGVREHFRRSLVIPRIRLAEWSERGQ